MTPQAFIAKWRDNPLTERAGAQAHFEDLCALLEVEPPRIEGEYQYERGLIKKSSASQGWADVWKRGCFAWEYKAPDKDLGAALKQLMVYALALDNPPLLLVSDRKRIEIHTHFTGTPSEVHSILLEDIGQPENLQKLHWLFNAPERFKPRTTTYAVTEEAARKMGKLAERLNARNHAPLETAHFLIQCVFCMFAEDARLLPEKLFETVLNKSNPDGAKAQSRLTELFTAMRKGGDFALETIPYFNGGLFELIEVPPLTTEDVVQLLDAARMGWGEIEPAILGTLFERGLNPDMRSQLGAHYTDPATILKLICPVIEQPLIGEWNDTRAKLARLAPQFGYEKGRKKGEFRPNEARTEGQSLFNAFLERLKRFRVLDPACGSGNFLYLALKTLKDIEHRANLEAEALGLQRELTIETSPANVLGIELNPYAAELARVTVWIGEIQWMLTHGYALRRNPILQPLDHIENRDAVLQIPPSPPLTKGGMDNVAQETSPFEKGGLRGISEPEWPDADAIVGNPPFLGGSKKRGELGSEYFNALNRVYKDRVPGGADLVTYWFEKARAQVEAGKAQRVGLVATQAIRAGSNRKVLERIVATAPIFEAWSDEPWINNGAAVRVSLVCFGDGKESSLDGKPVSTIHADLTAGGGLDLTQAKPLAENSSVAFKGAEKNGAFDVPGETARQWLKLPNPNGHANAKVVKPWKNGQDIAGRPSDTWVIDFGVSTTENEASLFETPFAHALVYVKPERAKNNDANRKKNWWRFGRNGADMRSGISGLSRYIVTPRVAKYRYFVWCDATVSPDSRLYVIASDSNIAFGILSSRIHEVWSLAQASMHGDGNEGGRPTYNAKSCFETFPFPTGLTPALSRVEGPRVTASPSPQPSPLKGEGAQSIATTAAQLNALRETWLNPPEWVDWVRTKEEEQAGFPLRPVAKPGHEAELKKRTLTNLYNARPAWLDNAHRELDAAVAAAYGWTGYTPEMPNEEILKRLLALNLERSAKKS
ncbi:class I SAM-dependent DNA methyltransferase [Thiobacillus denitrificans]|uniref:site-specific DNA-methyltransferase (adenine-specific) n=1 Tax=Thiobacillus denitrificans TaxID=36861 RepID=A0A106BQW8_THIDE|nr:DNA methyltransferase [Thiobacillus denitrificans]KVW96987.1 DNA methyltransferase [Thiobacillus denitrificans]